MSLPPREGEPLYEKVKKPRVPIETKVTVGATTTGAVSVVADLVIWTIALIFYHANGQAGEAERAAIASVPLVLAIPIRAVVTAAASFLGGYFAPHTLREEEVVKLVEAVKEVYKPR